MFNFINKIILFLICFGCVVLSHGSVVEGIYSSVLQVRSQQPLDREAAFNEALGRVLLKASGDYALSGRQDVLQRFYPAEQYVLSFSYTENPAYAEYQKLVAERSSGALNGEQSIEIQEHSSELSSAQADLQHKPEPLPFLMEVNFSGKALEQAMLANGVAIWGNVRPTIMFWVVLEEDGRRQLLGTAEKNQLSDLLMVEAAQFALPVIYPAADEADFSNLNVSDLWGLFPDAISQAKTRYKSDGDLMVRVYKSLDNSWIANWQLLLAGERYSSSLQAEDLNTFSRALLGEVTSLIAERFAVKADMLQADNRIHLLVTDIQRFQDYVDVQNFLEKLAPVKKLSIDRVEGTTLTLSVELNSDAIRFYEYLSLSGRFEKLAVADSDVQMPLYSNTSISESAGVAELNYTVPVERFRWISNKANMTLN